MINTFKFDDSVIDAAKDDVVYLWRNDIYHEHNDCIRIACEWLAAQNITRHRRKHIWGLKTLIECWASRYISGNDLEVAAHLLGMPFKNGHIAISQRLVLPCQSRLKNIAEANTQTYGGVDELKMYKSFEMPDGSKLGIKNLPNPLVEYYKRNT
jgi:hypothetical protein